MIGRGAFAVERVYAALGTEVMSGDEGIPLIKAQAIFASQQVEPAFMNLGHHGVFLGTQ